MLLRTLPLAIGRVLEPGRRGLLAAVRSVAAHVDLQRPLPRRPTAGAEHRHRCVVAVERLRREDVAVERIHERLEQLRSTADPVGER